MSGFTCECDYEVADVYNSSRKVARKQYQCDECFGPINAGAEYERAFMVYDGNADSFFTCADCLSIRDWVIGNIPCFCFAHGDMLNTAAETVREAAAYAPEETVGLRFGFLRRKYSADKRRQAARLAMKPS